MFKINRRLEYALIALKYMSHTQPGQLTSAKIVCDIFNMPFDPTARVLQIMAQNGILKSDQGAHGGYQIIKDLSKVTVLELAEMIVGPIQIANCFHGNYGNCHLTANCNVVGPMLNLNENMTKLFKTISVKDLIESRHQTEKIIKDKYEKTHA
jgi:Rrf2 family protein